jgi:hypothetical protein
MRAISYLSAIIALAPKLLGTSLNIHIQSIMRDTWQARTLEAMEFVHYVGSIMKRMKFLDEAMK